MTIRWAGAVRGAGALVALLAAGSAAAQTPAETFGEKVVVRETSVAALPVAGGSGVPGIEQVSVTIDGLAQRVTRIEPLLEGKRGEWRLVIYLDPRLAGARTRFLAALALAQRAESLAAMGTVEVLVAGAAKPALERTDSWQRIEAALLSLALEAKHRLARGDAPTERPGWDLFGDRLQVLQEALANRGAGGPRALFLPSDGLYSATVSEQLGRIARAIAAAGWIVVPMPWAEAPDEASAARLSEFESWRQSAAGRESSAGTRQYVIDLGRVFRRLRDAGESPPPPRLRSEPQLAALQALAAPGSGLLAASDGELRAALSNLARRWRIWFQAAEGGAEPRPLEVRLGEERLGAPGWILLPKVE